MARGSNTDAGPHGPGTRLNDTDLRTGAAFWPVRDGLLGTYPPLDTNERCQVVVIGAGITGALAAHRLSEAGCDVVVVDRHDAGWGSTAASSGLLLYETDTTLTDLAATLGIDTAVRSWRLGREAIDQIERLCDWLGPSGFARRPSLYLASSRWAARGLKSECALRAAHGFDVEWRDRAALHRRHGLRAAAAIYSEGEAEIDPYRFTQLVLADVRRRNGRVYDRTEVTRVHTTERGVTLETDRGPTITADRLVVAAGYDLDRQLGKSAGTLNSTWAVVSEPVADLSWWPGRSLVWETRRPYLYLRTTEDDRVMIGGEDEPWSSRHANTRLLRSKAQRLVERLSGVFPLPSVEVAYAWAGVFGATRDGLPYIGSRPGHPHTWFALGYGGNGITFSMVAANLIRDWWTGCANPDGQLFAFDR